MKKLELRQLIKEEVYKTLKILKEVKEDKYLTMVSLFTDKNKKWHNKDWFFDPSFKIQGLVAEYGKGANGQGWGKPVILCSDYDEDDPFFGSHDGWKWAVIFKKNINEIYLDDEIFFSGQYPSKEQKEKAHNYINEMVKNKQDISLGDLHNKFGVIITSDNFPIGNYVLNIKPNEIIKTEFR
jgi:hypothetical protein